MSGFSGVIVRRLDEHVESWKIVKAGSRGAEIRL